MSQKVSDDPLFRKNHLTAVRWMLASLVAVGHLWILTEAYEPLTLHGWSASYLAVNGFFILSGLLIAKSLSTRQNIGAYFRSRALRIYPALVLILLAFAFFFSPFFSEPGGVSHVTAAETWKFIVRVLLLGNPEGAPGGIFAGNFEQDFNGPLWTIRYEIAAYILAAAAFYIGAAKSLSRTLSLFCVVQVAYVAAPFVIDLEQLPAGLLPLMRLSSAFLMGMVLWHWPVLRRPPIWSVVALSVLFLIFGGTIAGELIGNLMLTGIIMRIGLSQTASTTLIKLPDYSYGIYIWHYPVMQAILFLLPELGPWQLMLLSVPIFTICAGLSWHYVEKPFLKLKIRNSAKYVPA